MQNGVYQLYYDFAGEVRSLRPHQVLAINRGEREGVLKVTLEIPEAEALGLLALRYPADMGSALVEDLIAARKDGYGRLLFPAIERDARVSLPRWQMRMRSVCLPPICVRFCCSPCAASDCSRHRPWLSHRL